MQITPKVFWGGLWGEGAEHIDRVSRKTNPKKYPGSQKPKLKWVFFQDADILAGSQKNLAFKKKTDNLSSRKTAFGCIHRKTGPHHLYGSIGAKCVGTLVTDVYSFHGLHTVRLHARRYKFKNKRGRAKKKGATDEIAMKKTRWAHSSVPHLNDKKK